MSRPVQEAITIGDLAARTGLTVATLRAWEARYGFPAPRRSGSGHRRYTRRDADQLATVVRLRAAGLSLDAAIAQARGAGPQGLPTRSVFAELRRSHPDLRAQRLSRRAMTAISTAIEDECFARATEPVVVGFFQRESFYRAREVRWRELARTSVAAMVFADFPQSSAPEGGPVEIALAGSSPLAREWLLVCHAQDAAACLCGWQEPADAGAGGERRFEAVWSAAPDVAVDALRAAAGYARAVAGALVPPAFDVISVPADPAAVLAHTTALTNRIVAYLDGNLGRPRSPRA